MANSFQMLVKDWMYKCFGAEITQDKMERNYRFLEESLELVQACGMKEQDAQAMVRYVYGRKPGAPAQEVGGVMVTLAALCHTQNLDMMGEGAREADRINEPQAIEHIRKKQAGKPHPAMRNKTQEFAEDDESPRRAY